MSVRSAHRCKLGYSGRLVPDCGCLGPCTLELPRLPHSHGHACSHPHLDQALAHDHAILCHTQGCHVKGWPHADTAGMPHHVNLRMRGSRLARQRGSGFRCQGCRACRNLCCKAATSSTESHTLCTLELAGTFFCSTRPHRLHASQVYRGVLNKTGAMAIKTLAHMASEAKVIRFNAMSLSQASLNACIQCSQVATKHQ